MTVTQSPAVLADFILQPTGANVFEATVQQLATAIRLGVFANGESLPPERELADHLQVSRMTLREAIAALRDAGLVHTTRGRGGGTTVTFAGVAAPQELPEPTSAQLHDVLAFRRVVEPGAAGLCAERTLDAAQRAWLVSAVRECAAAEGTPGYRVADSRLHLAMGALCGSAMLTEAVTGAQAAIGDLLARIPVIPRNIRHSQQQHEQLLDAVLGGDPAAAQSIMREHCDATAALLQGLVHTTDEQRRDT